MPMKRQAKPVSLQSFNYSPAVDSGAHSSVWVLFIQKLFARYGHQMMVEDRYSCDVLVVSNSFQTAIVK